MSLKGDKYETQEEVRLRLEGSVVLYKEKPVYITRCSFPEEEDKKGEIARVYFMPLPYGKRLKKGERQPGETRKFLSSKNFDLAPFRMGYFNYKGRAYFASRAPVRQYKQGLTGKTCSIKGIKGRPADDINFDMMIKTDGFADMVAGNYPTFAEIGELLGDEEQSSVAISRSFAFEIDHDLDSLFLLHKGVRCGLALRDDKALRIPEKYRFLREEMEECGIPLA